MNVSNYKQDQTCDYLIPEIGAMFLFKEIIVGIQKTEKESKGKRKLIISCNTCTYTHTHFKYINFSGRNV